MRRLRWVARVLPVVVVLLFLGESQVDGHSSAEDQWAESESANPMSRTGAVQELIDTVRHTPLKEAARMRDIWMHNMQHMSDLAPAQVRTLWKQVDAALRSPMSHTYDAGRIQTVTGPSSSLWKQVFHAVKGSGLTQANAKRLTSLFRNKKSLGGVIVMRDHSGTAEGSTKVSDRRRTNVSYRRRTNVSYRRRTNVSYRRRTNVSYRRRTNVSYRRRTNVSYRRRTNVSYRRRTNVSYRRRTNVSYRRRTNVSYRRRTNVSYHRRRTNVSYRRRRQPPAHVKAHLAYGSGTAYFKSYAKEEFKEQSHHQELEKNHDAQGEYKFKQGEHHYVEERAEKAAKRAEIATKKATKAREKREKALEVVKKSHERHEKQNRRKEKAGKEDWFKKERWAKTEKSNKVAERAHKAARAKRHHEETRTKRRVREQENARERLGKSQELRVKRMTARMVERAKQERREKRDERKDKQKRRRTEARREKKLQAENSHKRKKQYANEAALKKARHLYHALRNGKLQHQSAHENEDAKRDVRDLKRMLNVKRKEEHRRRSSSSSFSRHATRHTIIHRRRRNRSYGRGNTSYGSAPAGSVHVVKHPAKKRKVVVINDKKRTAPQHVATVVKKTSGLASVVNPLPSNAAKMHVTPLIPARSSGKIVEPVLIAEGDRWAE